MTEDTIEELLYFADYLFPEKSVQELKTKQSIVLMLKRSSENLPTAVDEVVLQMVYGNSRKPPGSEKSPSQSSMVVKADGNDDVETMIGFWAPPNGLAKAATLKMLFPNVSMPFKLPDIAPMPPHVAVAYDAFKGRDVMELSSKYPGQVLAYGYFTSDIPGDAQLIVKTFEKFEAKTAPTTYEEKIVVKLAKINPEAMMAFSELGPSYISADTVQGEDECKIFFPDGYNAPEPEVVEIKKKSKKKAKNKPAAANVAQEGETHHTESEISVDNFTEIDHAEDETLIGEEDEADDDEDRDDLDTLEEVTLIGADKATSPMNDGNKTN